MARKTVSANIHRASLTDLEVQVPDVDLAMLDATTDADIERHKTEDGESLAALPSGRLVVPAAVVRKRLALLQDAFASLIGVPVGTVRNWEQGRVVPDPAARALLLILYREPAAALRALRAA